MTTPQSHKRRGKRYEVEVLDELRARGYEAERLALAGKDDEGDLVVKVGIDGHIIIEAKAPGAGNSIDLAGWLKEAEKEAENYAKARNLETNQVTFTLVIKARGKSVDQSYVVKRFNQVFPGRG